MGEPLSPRLKAKVVTALGEKHADKQDVVFAALRSDWVTCTTDLADYNTENEIRGLVRSLLKEHGIPPQARVFPWGPRPPPRHGRSCFWGSRPPPLASPMSSNGASDSSAQRNMKRTQTAVYRYAL